MELVVKIILMLLAVVVISLLLCLPVMWLWNWLMPEIFGLKEISFWQSMGLMLLSGFLFKGITSKD